MQAKSLRLSALREREKEADHMRTSVVQQTTKASREAKLPPASTGPTSSLAKPDANVRSNQVENKPKGGFKPIGQTSSSSSMKRFFPMDDDEADSALSPSKDLQDTAKDDSLKKDSDDSREGNAINSPTARRRRSSFRDEDGQRKDPRDSPRTKRNGSDRRDPDRPSPKKGERRSAQETAPPVRDVAPQERTASANNSTSVAKINGKATENGAETPQIVQVAKNQVYAIVSQVGEGTFGKVYKARNTLNGVHVALKRIRMETERDGFPVTAMREIKLLQSLRHKNVVQLMEMMVHHGKPLVTIARKLF